MNWRSLSHQGRQMCTCLSVLHQGEQDSVDLLECCVEKCLKIKRNWQNCEFLDSGSVILFSFPLIKMNTADFKLQYLSAC